MKIYFVSRTPAALKLNGEFAGRLDGFERCADINLKDNVFAEVCPAGKLSASFFIDEKLFCDPPDFTDVYLLGGGEALVSLRAFKSTDMQLKIIYQTRFCGNLVTVFSQGEVYLAVEGQKYFFCAVGENFSAVTAEEKTIAGYPVLALYGGDDLIIISHTGAKIFANRVASAEFGETLKAGLPLRTCTDSVALCEYAYDGVELRLLSSEISDRASPKNAIHVAFFESVLYGGDFKKYLSESLLPHAGSLREYLGNFTEVIAPMAGFYENRPAALAAGLCYPIKNNLFNVKYFAVSLKDGKIDNIYPAETP